jgi:hypothetical protein
LKKKKKKKRPREELPSKNKWELEAKIWIAGFGWKKIESKEVVLKLGNALEKTCQEMLKL